MYIGLSKSELTASEASLRDAHSAVLSVSSYMYSYKDSGMTVQMAPEVIVAYRQILRPICSVLHALRRGEVVDLEQAGKDLVEAVKQFETACETGVTVS